MFFPLTLGVLVGLTLSSSARTLLTLPFSTLVDLALSLMALSSSSTNVPPTDSELEGVLSTWSISIVFQISDSA